VKGISGTTSLSHKVVQRFENQPQASIDPCQVSAKLKPIVEYLKGRR